MPAISASSCENDMNTAPQTPDDLRAQADRFRQAERESWERSDTDGFLSQWALGLSARENDLKAQLIEQGGITETAALFDTEGNLIADARWVQTRYGMSWVYDTDDRGTVWFRESEASTEAKRVASNASRGHYVGCVKVKATVKIVGGGTGLAGAASCYPAIVPLKNRDGSLQIVEILDNGK